MIYLDFSFYYESKILKVIKENLQNSETERKEIIHSPNT